MKRINGMPQRGKHKALGGKKISGGKGRLLRRLLRRSPPSPPDGCP